MTEATEDLRVDDALRFKANQQKAIQIVSGVREITDAAVTKPLLIEHLISKQVSGCDYVEAINAYDQHPIILLTP